MRSWKTWAFGAYGTDEIVAADHVGANGPYYLVDRVTEQGAYLPATEFAWVGRFGRGMTLHCK